MTWYVLMRLVLSLAVSVCLVLAVALRGRAVPRTLFYVYTTASLFALGGFILSSSLVERSILAPWAWALAFGTGAYFERKRAASRRERLGAEAPRESPQPLSVIRGKG